MRGFLETGLAAALALVLAANGVAMLTASVWWYGAVPGVALTGSFNGHFVKDIGAAYLAAACGLTLYVRSKSFAAVLCAAVFLGFHALIHLAAAIASPTCGHDLARDFSGVFMPALLSGGLTLSALIPVAEARHV